jgi:hypothetical protein
VPFCDFLDNPLAVLRMIDEMEVGPDRFEDETDVLDAVEVALGERRFAGIGGTGGVSSTSLIFLRPREALRLCCSFTESWISIVSFTREADSLHDPGDVTGSPINGCPDNRFQKLGLRG